MDDPSYVGRYLIAFVVISALILTMLWLFDQRVLEPAIVLLFGVAQLIDKRCK